jgi:Tol biopolymer transport system component
VTDGRWPRVKALFQAAVERPIEERDAFLAAATGDDEALRREVESLLNSDTSDASFLGQLPVASESVLAGPLAALPTSMDRTLSHTVLAAGLRVGPYEIVVPLGAGGMGEVYRARDAKLGRDVAIKVLPRAFTSDPDRRARFEREARVLASLNHPHIGAIYGLEDVDGMPALVMELVDGEDLAQRIARGPIPLAEALPMAAQIADALEAAHNKSIVHRDLKPANIKITPEGIVKVLDFGLAKPGPVGVGAPDGPGEQDLTNSPTMIVGTGERVILGTAAYMSPEQARGKVVDKRTDIWAFGCVFYEMLTGRAPFPGETLSDTMAAILEREPPWAALPAATPARIRQLLKRCLEKEPKRRLRDAGDARLEIDEAPGEPQMDSNVVSVLRLRARLAWTALAVVMVAVAVAVIWALRPVPPVPEMRLEITTPSTTDPVSLALSPDGQKIVFVATSEGRLRLWVRSLDSVSARPLAGTDNPSFPFWSPDSRSVGFFADGKLKRIDVDGGSIRALANASAGRGGEWNRDGTIIFSPRTNAPIFRVSATGGEPVPLTRLDPPQGAHRFPKFLPDGRHFIYYVTGGPETNGVYIGQLDGSETRRLFDADAGAVYASSGQLLFVRQGTLFAQDFDPVRLALTGNPYLVGEQVEVAVNGNGTAALSASAGHIVYRTGSASGLRQFLWLDRTGKELGKIGEPDAAGPLNPSLSPSGHSVALQRTLNGNTDIWLLEAGRGVLNRLTSDASIDFFPMWSSDGSRIVFSSNRKGVVDLYQKSATETGSEELLLPSRRNKVAMDSSPDGRFLLYRNLDEKTGYDLWILPLDGDQKPLPFAQTKFEEREGQFSPDGKWIAYVSDESGPFDIYVQPFPGPGGKSQISTNGGGQVHWRRDGKEIYYIAPDGRLMAVPIRLASDGPVVEIGVPVPLFATRVGEAVQDVYRQQYMVSPDGQRFLINVAMEKANASPMTIILNWRPKR